MNIAPNKYSQDLRRYYRMPAIQSSLTLVLSLFVMAFFIVFALRPTIISIVTLKKNIAESTKTFKTLETKVANLQKAATQLENIKPSLPTLNLDIPNIGASYNPIVMAVESIANQTNVKIDNESLGETLLFSRLITPYAPSKNQNVVILPFSVRVTGSYMNVMEFLKRLLSMNRIILAETVTISREASTKISADTVSLNISGNAYYLADEALLKKSLEVKGQK